MRSDVAESLTVFELAISRIILNTSLGLRRQAIDA
jgi:hypothetical protein